MTETKTRSKAIDKLFQTLSLVESCNRCDWNMVMLIVKGIKENTIDVSNYSQEHWMYGKTDLSEIDTWSTMDSKEGISLVFSINHYDKLTCKAKIYDCNNFGGRRERLKFTVDLTFLSDDFISNLSSDIEYELKEYLDDAYEAHLENQKREWITEERKKLNL